MSRARSISINGEKNWYDTKRNSHLATPAQLELLASSEDIEFDDLLEEGLSQGEVIVRLRKILGQGSIPPEILQRQHKSRVEAAKTPVCRICSNDGLECEGRTTKHHFINKWIMKELENYEAYASRKLCTIPVCVGRHRDLHMRENNGSKSIYKYLTATERQFAQKMLDEIKEQHPKIFDLAAGGDPEVSYVACLVADYQNGNFSHKGEIEVDVIKPATIIIPKLKTA